MQVWSVLHAARWKYRSQKIAKKSPYRHHRTPLSGCIFATKACIDNRKKIVKQPYLYMSCRYGELWPTNGWDRFVSLGHPCKFQWVLRLGSLTARHCSSERQPTAALNTGLHLYSAGRPSRWALACILVLLFIIRSHCSTTYVDAAYCYRRKYWLMLIINSTARD